MRTIEEIEEILRPHRRELHDRFKVKEIGIFGSFVKGVQKETSDLDLLVDFEQTPSLFELIRLERYLSEQLGLKVDLVMKKGLKPRIGKQILKEVVYV